LDIKVGDRVILRDHTSVNLGNSPAHPVPIHTTVRMQGDSLCAPVHLAYLHYFGTSSEPQLTFGVQKELKREVPL
jgi:meiotically up-regulated gene 157 (Mug157) protein